ncbi:hypothetical protein F2Q69_00004054 [Brassica cretica]|uniref:Uncharacterized protein n=1 Tax=Brassica cretica TaxID=69181 RepID=A0A8S9P5F3_BRACR|nr:hypothetical protein F2Q69_00004054 [Brassica cretica]
MYKSNSLKSETHCVLFSHDCVPEAVYMYMNDGRGIWADDSQRLKQGYASLCFIGSELRLLWFWADVSVSFPARMTLADGYPKDFPAQE